MKLIYQKLEDAYILKKLDGGKSDTLTLVFSGEHPERVEIGGKCITLTGGRGHLSLSSLPDGVLTPRVYEGKARFCADPVEKRGKRILRPAPCAEDILALRTALFQLKDVTSTLERRLLALESANQNTVVF